MIIFDKQFIFPQIEMTNDKPFNKLQHSGF
jgi:hypothetical protein